MSKPHQINVDDLKKWMEESDSLYASSSKENKRLYARFNGSFRVVLSGNTIYDGKDIEAAVNAYNDITEVYKQPPFTL